MSLQDILNISAGLDIFFCYYSQSPELKLRSNSNSNSSGGVVPLSVEVSSRDFSCHCAVPEGCFHSAVADRVDM